MSKKRSWLIWAVVLLASMLGAGTFARAQKGDTDEGKRKVRSKVMPGYPELARRMNLSGKVKIEVVISPDGRVLKTKVIGGHPLLVSPSVEAVMKWRFVPSAEETTQVVEFDFARDQ